MKNKKKSWPWILAVLAVAAAAGLILAKTRNARESGPVSTYTAYTAEYGTVVRSITGNGVLQAADVEGVEAAEAVEIEEIVVEQGDFIRAGEALAAYDTDSLRDRLDSLYDDLASLDSEISSRETDKNITSPCYGRVKEIYAAVGDTLDDVMTRHGALMLLSTDDKMQVEIETDADLSIGTQVVVYYNDLQQIGTVANWTSDGYLITISDYYALAGTPARVTDYSGRTELGEGTIEIHAPVYVYGTGGRIRSVNVSVNDLVYSSTNIITMADDPVTDSYRAALADRDELAQDIAEIYALLENPILAAPSDGVVAEILAEEGSAVDGDAFTLHTGGAQKMTVAVDELDITSVSLGQSATVTLDAFSGESFPAAVTWISRLGTESGSITTYDVELTLQADNRFREGMNGSAVISAQQRDGVILIPVAAISEDETGAYVTVQADGGAARRDIVTGLSDGTMVEVRSGLSAGDVILYQELDHRADTFASMLRQQGPTPGGGN